MSRKQEYLIIAGLLVLIFPFFALLNYVHPQADDFFFASKVNELGVLDFVKEMYFTWSGRYSSMFIGAFDPVRYNSLILLRVVLATFFLFNLFSLFVFFKSLTTNLVSTRSLVLFTLASYLVVLNAIPDIFEFLYWFPSVTAYQLGFSLSLLYISVILFENSGRLNEKTSLLFHLILGIVLIGLLELFIVPTLILSGLSIAIRIKKNEKSYYKLALFLLLLILSVVTVAAPGNYVRMGDSDTFGLIIGVYLTLKSLVYIFGYLFQNPTFVLGLILTTSIIQQIISSDKKYLSFDIPKLNPILVFSVSLFIISLVFLPATLSLKTLPAGRIFNLGAYIIAILLLFNILFFVNYYKNQLSFFLSRFYQFVIGFMMFVFIFSGIYVTNLYEFKNNGGNILLTGNVLNAYYTLFNEAEPFNKDMVNRYNNFRKAEKENKTTLMVKPLEHHPEMLIFVDINDIREPGTWIFNWEAKYFGMDSIYIHKQDNFIREALRPEINIP